MGTATAKERRAMTATAKKTYDGLTEHVSTDDERERIRHSLYRTDASALGTVAPAWRDRWTDAELAQYQTQGYLAMDGLLTPDQVAQAKAALADIAHRRVWNERVGIQEEPYFRSGGSDERIDDPELRIRKLWLFCQADTRLAGLAASNRLIPLLDQLIGPGHRMVQDMALLKPPFHGAEKPWHQDTAYFDYTPLGGVIGVWIALDGATVENGCMQVIPGSHLAGPAQHYHVRDCQLADDRVAVDQAVVVPLKPGGALFDDNGAYAGCRDWDLEAGMSRARIEI